MSYFKQMTRKYKKKVEVVDDRSTPEARAARVKRLRNLANLSRKEMCDADNLNVNTLKGWEIARYGGLPLDGASKIIKRVAQEGVICTVEWLLYEDGPPPSVNVVQINEYSAQAIKQKSEEEKIAEELALFKKHYSATIQYQISDDGMSPFYQENDVVAGIKKIGQEIDMLIGLNCIVQLANSQVMCRKLRKGKLENLYNLICTNTETSVEAPIISDAELISAAEIIWHRKHHKKIIKKEKLAYQMAHTIRSPAAALQVLLKNSKNLNKQDQHVLRNILDSLNTIADNCLKQG